MTYFGFSLSLSIIPPICHTRFIHVQPMLYNLKLMTASFNKTLLSLDNYL